MKSYLGMTVLLSVVAAPVLAQDYMALATESGVCGDRGVMSVNFIAETNTIEATCNYPEGADAEGFLPLPLVGGLGPAAAVAGGFAVIAASAAGGNSPSDTQ